jgi:hypothetical protein
MGRPLNVSQASGLKEMTPEGGAAGVKTWLDAGLGGVDVQHCSQHRRRSIALQEAARDSLISYAESASVALGGVNDDRTAPSVNVPNGTSGHDRLDD